MAISPIYKSATFYELAMRLLYGRHYEARYRTIADLIPDRASVLDLCCGPARIYTHHLRRKSVTYTGLDISPRFIERLKRLGGTGFVWDLREDRPLPKADYVLMQASLYHFLPDARPVVDRMIEAAGQQAIISETIRNVATSQISIIAWLARRLTDPGVGEHSNRFNEESLNALFAPYRDRLIKTLVIPGNREKVFILGPKSTTNSNGAIRSSSSS